MNYVKILRYAIWHALGAVTYVVTIAFFIFNVGQKLPKEDEPLAIATFLMTFVTSAAIMGMLVFGRPLIWFLNGSKREGVMLAVATVGCMAVLACALFAVIFWKGGTMG
jgi:hypothetical protein